MVKTVSFATNAGSIPASETNKNRIFMYIGFIDLSRLRGFDIIQHEVNGRLVEGAFIPFRYNGIDVMGEGAYLHFNVSPMGSGSGKWNYMVALSVRDKKVAGENREYGFEKNQMKLGRMRIFNSSKYTRSKRVPGERNLDKLFE